jgi:hypothetical protein
MIGILCSCSWSSLSHFKLGDEIEDLQIYLNSLCRGFVAQLHSNNRKVAAADLESAVLQIQAANDNLQIGLQITKVQMRRYTTKTIRTLVRLSWSVLAAFRSLPSEAFLLSSSPSKANAKSLRLDQSQTETGLCEQSCQTEPWILCSAGWSQ